ncbi:unnamed protein product, partial [Tilletia controversa]
LDPYGAHNGLLWSHIGWMIIKPVATPASSSPPSLLVSAGMTRGGFYYAAVVHLVFVHHSTFCVNSLAHWP